MGRPSKAAERRAQIVAAFADQFASCGYERTTIAAIAERAGVGPGIVHHYFKSKREILDGLITGLERDVLARLRAHARDHATNGTAYINAMLALGVSADQRLAQCWVGLWAEAQHDVILHRRMQAFAQKQRRWLMHNAQLSSVHASALFAFVVGAIVLGSASDTKARGFAAPAGHALFAALRQA